VRHEWLVAKWKEALGVDITLNPVEPTTYTALTKDVETAPQMFLLGWCSDYPDPQNWLSVYFKSTTSNAEDIAYANDDFDALVNEADTTIDQATRMELYQQAQDVILEDSVVAFMYNTVNAYLVKPWVLGLETTPQDSDWPGSNNPVSIDIDTNLMP
jgi:oligopeptide transport system substrate-binding protein